MAEAIGIAASAVTLAALFSSCIDCFSYFKAAQNCSAEAETLLVKLDCEKARLLVWANTVGILRTDQQGRSPQLAGLEQEELIRRCIDQIIGLLTNAQELQAEYGGRPTAQLETQRYIAVVSVNSMNIFKTTKARFFASAGGPRETPSWLSRIKWAIRDGAKFRILLSHLKEFVDNIIELVPVSLDVINSTVEEDITTIIDISTLRLAESACEESYPRWSTRASEVIKESEIGTLDRRNLEEMIRDVNEPEVAKQESTSDRNQDIPLNYNSNMSKLFVVLTDECLDLETDSHCEAATIGRAISSTEDISFTCYNLAQWNLGRRILAKAKRSFEEISEAESRRIEICKATGELPDVIPIDRVYIHCGPCACAIQTALKLTWVNRASEYVDYAIRIDERLPTSCRRSSAAIEVLAAIHDTIDGYQVTYGDKSKSIGFIDCPELEKQIYNLEQETTSHFGPANILHTILNEYQDIKHANSVAAIVIIAEADTIHSSLEGQRFYSEARKPRDTDIFTFEFAQENDEWKWRRRYEGAYSRSKKSIEKKRARSSLLTDQIPPPSSNVTALMSPAPSNKRVRSESTVNSDA
ncbi:hypothetical protein MMC11_001900 [Xylographa trunciseda]|nr:hypothetical protein [Xylographa trunciseda]